jgi:tetratricopeptide (TPR) repeat protein
LGNAFGVDYIIKQGIVKNKDEWDKIVEEHDKSKNSRKNHLKKYDLEKEIDELIRMGDSLIQLAKSVDMQEKTKFIRSAISSYQSAHNKLPNNPQITFRIGLTYNMLAEILEEENEHISNDYFTLAIEELDRIFEQTTKPIITEFDKTYYLLPYHALYHKAAAYISLGDYQNALKNFKRLINCLDICKNNEFPEISEQIKQNTIKATDLLLREINE